MLSPAAHAADQWYQAASDLEAPTGAHSPLKRVLSGALGLNAEVGIAYQRNQPAVVAIEGPRLVCARPEDPAVGGPEAVIALDSIPLDVPLRIGVTLSQQTLSSGRFLIKSWTLGEPVASSFQVDTRTPLSHLQGSEYGGRAVLEKAVAKLGWTLPEGG